MEQGFYLFLLVDGILQTSSVRIVQRAPNAFALFFSGNNFFFVKNNLPCTTGCGRAVTNRLRIVLNCAETAAST